MPSAIMPNILTTNLKNNTSPRLDAHTQRFSGHASPYYDSDSDNEQTPHAPSYTTTLKLRASIATMSEARLREIMVRLVDRSSGFQHAVAKELLPSAEQNSNVTSSPRRKRRRSGRRSLDTTPPEHRPCMHCGKRPKNSGGDDDTACIYHPGQLKDEVYEFLSCTPEGRALEVRRRITMWSCCDEDARSPGCASALTHVCAAGDTRRTSVSSNATSSGSTKVGEFP